MLKKMLCVVALASVGNANATMSNAQEAAAQNTTAVAAGIGASVAGACVQEYVRGKVIKLTDNTLVQKAVPMIANAAVTFGIGYVINYKGNENKGFTEAQGLAMTHTMIATKVVFAGNEWIQEVRKENNEKLAKRIAELAQGYEAWTS